MDSILAIVALIAFYALQAMAAKKRKAASQTESASPDEVFEAAGPDPGDEMAEALAEIRQALGMGAPAAPPRPSSPVEHPSSAQERPERPTTAHERPSSARQRPERPTPTRERPSPKRKSPESPSAKTRERLSDEFHRVHTGRPDAEQAFERQQHTEWKAREMPTTKWPERKILTSKTPLEEQFESVKPQFRDPLRDHHHVPLKAVPLAKPKVVKRLATPQEIREAIILSEIIGPPKALRNRR